MTIAELIEDKSDLEAYEKALEEYKADPVTYPLEDVIKELDLTELL